VKKSLGFRVEGITIMRHQKHRSSNNAYQREYIGDRASSQYTRAGRQYFKPNFGKYYGSEFDRDEERRLASNIRRSAEPSGSSRYDQYHEERGGLKTTAEVNSSVIVSLMILKRNGTAASSTIIPKLIIR
jgi:hypothetical protein